MTAVWLLRNVYLMNNAPTAPRNTNDQEVTMIRTNVTAVLEGDTITTAGARYLVIGEPTYVRRGQLYVRLVLEAVPAGLKTGLLSGPYDLLASDDVNVG